MKKSLIVPHVCLIREANFQINAVFFIKFSQKYRTTTNLKKKFFKKSGIFHQKELKIPPPPLFFSKIFQIFALFIISKTILYIED